MSPAPSYPLPASSPTTLSSASPWSSASSPRLFYSANQGPGEEDLLARLLSSNMPRRMDYWVVWEMGIMGELNMIRIFSLSLSLSLPLLFFPKGVFFCIRSMHQSVYLSFLSTSFCSTSVLVQLLTYVCLSICVYVLYAFGGFLLVSFSLFPMK